MRRVSLLASCVVLLLAGAPSASAESRRGIEAERASVRGARVADPSASGGQTVKVRIGRRAIALRAPLERAATVDVRVRGCGGSVRVAAGRATPRVFRVGRQWRSLKLRTAAGRATSPISFSALPAPRLGSTDRRRSCTRISVDRVDVAARPVPLGTAIRDDVLSTAPGYGGAVGERFGAVTPENELKMELTQPFPGVFDFSRADRLVAFASQRGLPVRGHALVYDQQLPQWVTRPAVPWTRETLIEVLRSHITALVGRYRGRIDTWDVANEVLTPEGRLKPSIWQRVIGDDYLDLAFRFARDADPGARLVLNDVGVERAGLHQDGLATLVRDLRGRGVPVDGVGFQAHVDQAGVPSSADLDRTLTRFADLGVSTEVTEADVPLAAGADASAVARQAAIFGDLATACWEHATCTSCTVWGADDGHSWRGPDTQATLLDATYRPKRAWGVVAAALAGRRP